MYNEIERILRLLYIDLSDGVPAPFEDGSFALLMISIIQTYVLVNIEIERLFAILFQYFILAVVEFCEGFH